MTNRLKRNKSKDNPYTIGFNEDLNSYTVEFKDGRNIFHEVEISEKVFKAFDEFELEDISQIHKFRKHIEHNEVYEETLEHRMIDKPITIEDEVENDILMEELKNVINRLSDIQKRRIKLYFFEDISIEKIAKIEGTSHQAVSKSIKKSIEEIKKMIKN